jgi:hypothetical protein
LESSRRHGLTVIGTSTLTLTKKLYEMLAGRPLIMKGSRSSLGATKWTLHRIINLCNAIHATMLESARNVDKLKDEDGQSLLQISLTGRIFPRLYVSS